MNLMTNQLSSRSEINSTSAVAAFFVAPVPRCAALLADLSTRRISLLTWWPASSWAFLYRTW